MPKKLLAITIIIVTILALVVSTLGVEVGDANPYFNAKQINPPSDAIPPIISINSPQNNTSYSGKFNISFSVKGAQYSDYFSDIADVTYIIDNETVHVPHGGDVLAISQYNTSFIGPTLTAGNHSLIVKARGIVYSFSVLFFMDSSSQVYFVTSENSTPSIISHPSETMGEGSGLDSTATPALPKTPLLVAIVSSAVIIVAASLSVFYLKKKRTNK